MHASTRLYANAQDRAKQREIQRYPYMYSILQQIYAKKEWRVRILAFPRDLRAKPTVTNLYKNIRKNIRKYENEQKNQKRAHINTKDTQTYEIHRDRQS